MQRENLLCGIFDINVSCCGQAGLNDGRVGGAGKMLVDQRLIKVARNEAAPLETLVRVTPSQEYLRLSW